ncbi:MAG TPA: hypothetical protein VMD58_11685 [Acidobacteriaceae bacterium]|nr:hypothetical protein [Acidobacteriaceae bacterium]
MSTFLKHIGSFFKSLFVDAAKVAKVAEPVVDLAFPSVANLYNFTVQQASLAETAAAGVSGAGEQKLAAVVAAVTPYATSALQADGVPAPTNAQITAYVNAVVASLNALPAPATTSSSQAAA